MSAYYYRDGARIEVRRSSTAFVVTGDSDEGERQSDGWQRISIGSGRNVVVERSVVPADEERSETDPLADLPLLLVRAEVASMSSGSERSTGPLVVSDDARVSPVLIERSGGLLFTLPQVVVSLRSSVVPDVLSRYDLTVEREISYVDHGYLCTVGGDRDPLDVANALVEDGMAIFAHPVFTQRTTSRTETLHAEAGPSGSRDGFAARFGAQWHLRNTGQGGAVPGTDVGIGQAWRSTFGSPTVTVAIIDSGIALDHDVFAEPDKLHAARDFADGDDDPTPEDSNHGTSCAALAVGGGATGQVLGVAPSCGLIAIRRTPLTDHLALADALVWAADNGADVISCSWGVDGQPWVLPDVARDALRHVTTTGRSGRGTPVFWAAGNGFESVSTDEWASSPYTMAIAACTDGGRHAAYSDRGPEIWVCAPSSGGANSISTADNSGYTDAFGGTSAAAPIAAGVGALLLSMNPDLGWRDVAEVLRSTARKIGGMSSYDENGHSVVFGYGQVDAGAAVAAAATWTAGSAGTGHGERSANAVERLPATDGIGYGQRSKRGGEMATSGLGSSLDSLLEQLFPDGTSSGPANGAPTDTDAGAGRPGVSTTISTTDLQDVLKVCMYSQAMPVLTEGDLLRLEAGLPQFVDALRSLSNRPAAMAQMKEFVTAAGGGKEGAASAAVLAQALGAPEDVGDGGERLVFVPLIGVAIAAGALGYTIGHTWGR